MTDIEFKVAGDEKIVFIRLELFDGNDKEIFCDTRHYALGDFKELFKLAPASVEVLLTGMADGIAKLTLTNNSGVVAAGVRLKFANLPVDDIYYMDNYLDLLPGESRTVEIKIAGVAEIAGEVLETSGWNVPFENVVLR